MPVPVQYIAKESLRVLIDNDNFEVVVSLEAQAI
jgi:hypothetical protein